MSRYPALPKTFSILQHRVLYNLGPKYSADSVQNIQSDRHAVFISQFFLFQVVVGQVRIKLRIIKLSIKK